MFGFVSLGMVSGHRHNIYERRVDFDSFRLIFLRSILLENGVPKEQSHLFIRPAKPQQRHGRKTCTGISIKCITYVDQDDLVPL